MTSNQCYTMKYQDILSRVGGFGRYQKLFYLMAFMVSIPNGLIPLMFVFIHYLPQPRCSIPLIENVTRSLQETLLNLTIPWNMNNEWILERSKCERFNISDKDLEMYLRGNSSLDLVTDSVIKCDRGWKYSLPLNSPSAATEFNMVCGDSWKIPSTTSILMLGWGVGACTGVISDRFGKRIVFLYSTFLGFAFIGLAGFAWNYTIYTIFVFLVGTSALINYMVIFVMASEVTGEKHRNMVALSLFLAYTLGYVLSPLVGYLLQNWRWYLWANGLLGILHIPLIWVMPQSPRWLITSGRIDEAKKVLRNIADANGKKVDIETLFEQAIKLNESFNVPDKTREWSFCHVYTSVSMMSRTLVINFAWLVTSMVYYAIALNTSNFSGDRFINCFLSALTEPPSYLLSWFMLKRIGRPRTLFLFMGISGISCSIIPLMQMTGRNGFVTIIAILGKTAIAVEFYAVYLCVAEISPTLVRNFSYGIASSCARIGAFIAPYLLFAGKSIHSSIPYIVMGMLAIISSVLCVAFIPETKGVPLPDSRQEAMQNRKYYGLKIWKAPPNEPEHMESHISEEDQVARLCHTNQLFVM